MLPYDRRLDPKGSVMTADLHLKCLECSRRFSYRPTPRGRYPRTCSPTCRASRKRAHDRRYRAEGRYTAGNRKSYSGICSVCAAPFVSQNRPTRTCSRQCGAIWNGRLRTERSSSQCSSLRAMRRVVPACQPERQAKACPPSAAILFHPVRRSGASNQKGELA
jgi:hypothetical protein